MKSAPLFPQTNWHQLSVKEVCSQLHTIESGLEREEISTRQQHDGLNVIPKQPAPSLLRLFLSQFTSPLVYVLLFCAALIYFIHGVADSSIITIILLLNAVIGTYQEYRSQSTLADLQKFTTTVAHVIRDGQEIEIPDSELVRGDIIVIREGEKVPADARLFEVDSLRSDESALTGESLPVQKQTEIVQSLHAVVSDQHNMIFKGTTIATGTGKAIVTTIGTQTVIGSLAATISSLNTDVPLARKIKKLAGTIVIWVLAAVILFFALSVVKGLDFADSLTTAISLTVALIPEGLPVILTLVLATSVSRMSKRNVLVKRLQAVEALGSASIIAVDKTGTITLNELSVKQIVTSDEKVFTLSGQGFDQKGSYFYKEKDIGQTRSSDLEFLLSILQSTTTGYIHHRDGRNIPVGDPTEIAGLIAVSKYPHSIPKLHRLAFQAFDYHRKFSSHLLEGSDGQQILARVGAADVILKQSDLSASKRKQLEESLHTMQREGVRVIAVATHRFEHTTDHHVEDLFSESYAFTSVRLIGMQDSLQVGAHDAITNARNAGLHVIMITGDHAETAKAIAAQVGIYSSGDRILSGDDIEKMSTSELSQTLKKKPVSVFARVTPEHKLQIIQALRANGETVAMTGDGVNDAASLVAADLGIAMGIKGTEVAKDAADIVLIDDNFKSITAAIEEGRALYLTIKNVIVYLLSSSAGEALTMFGALLLGFAAPISAAQIIWLNFVTDGFLDVALSFEPHEKDILHKRWTISSTALVDRSMFIRTLLTGAWMAVGTVFVFAQFSHSGSAVASTMTLTTLAAFQWFHAWNCRSQDRSLTSVSFFANMPLIYATCAVIILQLTAMYIPLFQKLLHTTALSLPQWLICIGIASTIIIIDEIRKSLLSKNSLK